MRGRACPFPVCTTSEPVETLSLSLSLSQAAHESSSMKPIFTKQPFPPGTSPSLPVQSLRALQSPPCWATLPRLYNLSRLP